MGLSVLKSGLRFRYNVCIMAYGQTGSGKSFTALGPHSKGEPAPQPEALGDSGVIPRAAGELFRYRRAVRTSRDTIDAGGGSDCAGGHVPSSIRTRSELLSVHSWALLPHMLEMLMTHLCRNSISETTLLEEISIDGFPGQGRVADARQSGEGAE